MDARLNAAKQQFDQKVQAVERGVFSTFESIVTSIHSLIQTSENYANVFHPLLHATASILQQLHKLKTNDFQTFANQTVDYQNVPEEVADALALAIGQVTAHTPVPTPDGSVDIVTKDVLLFPFDNSQMVLMMSKNPTLEERWLSQCVDDDNDFAEYTLAHMLELCKLVAPDDTQLAQSTLTLFHSIVFRRNFEPLRVLLFSLEVRSLFPSLVLVEMKEQHQNVNNSRLLMTDLALFLKKEEDEHKTWHRIKTLTHAWMPRFCWVLPQQEKQEPRKATRNNNKNARIIPKAYHDLLVELKATDIIKALLSEGAVVEHS